MPIQADNDEPIVFVVDDEPLASHAVADLVRSFGRQAEAFGAAAELLNRLDEIPPTQVGCIVFGLRMPAMDGFELHARLTERDASLPAICVTAYADTASTVKLLRNGALAVLDKPFRENELWSFVQEALAKSEEQQRLRAHHRALERQFKRLSVEDREVLQLILKGCKNSTMANRLGVSLRTVENRRRRVFEVMQADSVAQLTRLVLEYEHKLPPAAAGSEAWLVLPFEPVA